MWDDPSDELPPPLRLLAPMDAFFSYDDGRIASAQSAEVWNSQASVEKDRFRMMGEVTRCTGLRDATGDPTAAWGAR